MSNNTNFWLELNLEFENRNMILDVNSVIATKEFEVLVKIIEKASQKDIDLSPISKVLKDDLLTKLCADGWKINSAKFVVKKHELLEYFKDRKAKGGTASLAIEERWPWVHVSDVDDFGLMFDGHIMTTRYVEGSPHGGYVHKSYYKRNQEIADKLKGDSSKSSWKEFANDDKPKSTKKETKFNLVQMTKAEGKICRKEIIALATMSDICQAGFKPQFMESLSDRHRSYLHGCTNLQVKLMKSEVAKNNG